MLYFTLLHCISYTILKVETASTQKIFTERDKDPKIQLHFILQQFLDEKHLKKRSMWKFKVIFQK